MILYHGSLCEIQVPQFHFGNPNNDYGLGFYCTESLDLAKEWGCSEEKDGFANEYDFDAAGLRCLNLGDSSYNILNWLAILLQNRTFEVRNDIAIEAKRYIMNNFLMDYSSYDIIRGYRADDSYFSFANAFLNNIISLQKLNEAMHLGRLGEQIVLKSEQSFAQIHFIKSHISSRGEYFPKKSSRDQKARDDFANIKKQNRYSVKDELFVLDLIRKEVLPSNASLQRTLS